MQARHLHGNTRVADFTPVAACSGGDVVLLPTGKAGVCVNDIAAGVKGSAYEDGVFECVKNTDGALLIGSDAFWDVSAGHAQYKPDSGTPDFFMGCVVEYDEPTTDETVNVDLNKHAEQVIDLQSGEWTTEATNGLGVTLLPGGGAQLAFDAVAEAAQAALYSNNGVLGSAKPILEARVGIFDIGDNAALDIDVGMATGSHATNFETVDAFAAIHLDGNALTILSHSDDTGTDRAPATTGITAVDDTYFELWIDCRDDTDIDFYINAVLVDNSASKRILTAALASTFKPIVMIEKTSDDTVADVRVSKLRVRAMAE